MCERSEPRALVWSHVPLSFPRASSNISKEEARGMEGRVPDYLEPAIASDTCINRHEVIEYRNILLSFDIDDNDDLSRNL